MPGPEKHGTERCEVLYSGHVQGVGFRYTTCRIASQFAVSGSVRNLSDGRVELIVEGEKDELQHFLNAISCEMSNFIRQVDRNTYPPTGEFHGFTIGF